MEVPPSPDQDRSTADQDLGGRLANVEARLDAISERLGRLETSLRDTVSTEVHGATAELRRAISELGRRLVQDLPSQLARHRDMIVAELRPPPPPPPPPAPEPTASVDAAFVPAPEAAVPLVDAPAEGPEGAEAPGRRRSSRRRRRHG